MGGRVELIITRRDSAIGTNPTPNVLFPVGTITFTVQFTTLPFSADSPRQATHTSSIREEMGKDGVNNKKKSESIQICTSHGTESCVVGRHF